MPLKETLAVLGLTKNRATIYLALLEHGASGTSALAKRTGIARTTVHEVLQFLLTRGFITIAPNGRRPEYLAEHPRKLRSILKAQEDQLESSLPELIKLYQPTSSAPRVRVYEGADGIRSVLENTLTAKAGVLNAILSIEDVARVIGMRWFDSYTEKRIAKGLKLRVIRSEQKDIPEKYPASQSDNREVHFAPSDMLFNLSTYLYDDKVAVIGTHKENFGMIIESADYFTSQIHLFETLWQVTRVMPKQG